jgi:hypothetical protein
VTLVFPARKSIGLAFVLLHPFDQETIDLTSLCFYERSEIRNSEQLLATDILVLATMKNAAKCDT